MFCVFYIVTEWNCRIEFGRTTWIFYFYPNYFSLFHLEIDQFNLQL